MQKGESHHVQSGQEKVTPILIPEKVLREPLCVKPIVKVLSEPSKPIEMPHKCHGKVLKWMLDFVEDFLGGIRLH